MHWDRALLLAEKLDPTQIPYISREYAQQLEIKGEYAQAFEKYEQSLSIYRQQESRFQQKVISNEKYVTMCTEGIARCAIRLGDFRRGLQIALESDNKKFCRESAAMFEDVKQFSEAAQLYVRSGMYERAAEIYISKRLYKEFTAIMHNIKNPKIFLQYAKMREKDGKFQEALQAYELARDTNNVVRMLLERLNNPTRAIDIVKQNRSTAGAAMIGNYCLEKKNFKRAIEFFIMADMREKAFEIAAESDDMDTYALLLKHAHESERGKRTEESASGSMTAVAASIASVQHGRIAINGNSDEEHFSRDAEERMRQDNLMLAEYYESSKGDLEKAADYYSLCGQFDRALHLYIQCASARSTGKEQISDKKQKSIIDKAIEVVGRVRNDELTHRLVDFLMDDLDEVAHKHIFKLYMELGNFSQAVHTALMLAKQEQDAGNYIVAHNVLFDTYSQLLAKGERVPLDLKRSLVLLHSYLIIKDLVPLNQPQLPAQMLLRVAKNISRFPQHIVPILTSTVIQAYKAGMRKSAVEYATMLVHPDYLPKIDARFKKTISQIVRKRAATDMADVEGTLSPCPFCDFQLHAKELDCPQCKNYIPFCIVTGQHMVKDDCTQCPQCTFPALHSVFVSVIGQSQTRKCPMCANVVNLQMVKKLNAQDAERVLRKI